MVLSRGAITTSSSLQHQSPTARLPSPWSPNQQRPASPARLDGRVPASRGLPCPPVEHPPAMCGPTTGRPSSSTFGSLSFCLPQRPSLVSSPALSRSKSSFSSRFLGTHISRSTSAIVANFRRYFPYFITVGSLTVIFIIGIFWLIAQRRLLPAIVMIGAFMFFVLWLVGLVIVGIQLFGPNGSIQSVCDVQVFGRNPTGQSERTMAWLQQRNICTWTFSM